MLLILHPPRFRLRPFEIQRRYGLIADNEAVIPANILGDVEAAIQERTTNDDRIAPIIQINIDSLHTALDYMNVGAAPQRIL